MALNDSGRGRIDEVEPGDYWLKESKAAPGFAIDEAAYAVTVEPDKTATVAAGHVQDTPQSNAVDVVVAKADATTEKAQPQGDSALSGAEFTVEYYKGIYSSADEARIQRARLSAPGSLTDDEGKAPEQRFQGVRRCVLLRIRRGDAGHPARHRPRDRNEGALRLQPRRRPGQRARNASCEG
ncbi:MAG: collagen binding domain-containing protein [Eggerthella lenta]